MFANLGLPVKSLNIAGMGANASPMASGSAVQNRAEVDTWPIVVAKCGREDVVVADIFVIA